MAFHMHFIPPILLISQTKYMNMRNRQHVKHMFQGYTCKPFMTRFMKVYNSTMIPVYMAIAGEIFSHC